MRELLVSEKGVFVGLHAETGSHLFGTEEELRDNPSVLKDSIKQDRKRWGSQLNWFARYMESAIDDFEESTGERLSCVVVMGEAGGRVLYTRKFRDGNMPARFFLDRFDGHPRIDAIRVYRDVKGEAEIQFKFDGIPFLGHLYLLTESAYRRFKQTEETRSLEDYVQDECHRMKVDRSDPVQQMAGTHLKNAENELIGQFW